MERIRVNGVEIRLYRTGDGPQVLYLHSGFGELGPLPFVENLARYGLCVLTPEMPGFGASEPCRDWHKIEDVVFFYRQLLDVLDLEAPCVIGQSLGGWLAAELAVWFPERVSALVLIDAVGLHIEGAPIHELFGVDPVKLMPLVFPDGGNLLEHIAPALEGQADSDAVLLHFFRAMETTAAIGWSPYMHDPKLRERLHLVRAPALVIHGQRDGIVPLRHSEEYARLIPEARLHVLDDLGHLPALESPDSVAELVAEFLRAPAQGHSTGPRIPLPPVEDTKEVLQAAGVPAVVANLNISRALANSELLAKVVFQPTARLMTESSLPPRLRELVILRVAWLNGCEYEWTQHYRFSKAVGLDDEKVAAVRSWRESDCFEADERAVLEMTDTLWGGSPVPEELWQRLVEALDGSKAVLEAAAVAGAWTMVAYLLKTAAVPLEEGQPSWPPDGVPPHGRTRTGQAQARPTASSRRALPH